MESEWPERPVSELCELIVDCVNKTAPIVDYETPYKMIRTTNVRNGRIDLSGCRYVEEEIFQKWTRRAQVLKGDILLTREAPMGEVGLVRDNDTIFLGQRLMQYRANPKILDSRYLLYSFLSPALQHQFFVHEGTGSVVSHIRVPDCLNFLLKVPPIEEQKAIAHILGSLDDKIELNRRMNATLEAMAQALFKSWFVDFDPVIDNALAAGHPIPEPLQDRAEARAALGDHHQSLPEAIRQQFPNRFVCNEEMGWVPEGWKIELLKNLATKIGSGATPRGGGQVYEEEGTSLIRSQNVYDSRFVWDGLVRINEEAATQLKGVTVHQHDVLINITGASILRTCVVDPAVLPARVNQHVAIIRVKNQIPPRFIHLHLLQEKTKNLLLGQNAGASREAVTKGHLESVTILVPSEGLLQHFKQLTDPLYEKGEKLSHEARTLAQLRDTLLPKLLSGQLRIPEAEKLLAAL